MAGLVRIFDHSHGDVLRNRDVYLVQSSMGVTQEFDLVRVISPSASYGFCDGHVKPPRVVQYSQALEIARIAHKLCLLLDAILAIMRRTTCGKFYRALRP